MTHGNKEEVEDLTRHCIKDDFSTSFCKYVNLNEVCRVEFDIFTYPVEKSLNVICASVLDIFVKAKICRQHA